MGSDGEKIVFSNRRREGVDLSIIDFNQVNSVKIVVTKVVKTMYTEKLKTYIGTKDPLQPGEVIQVGNLGLRYKIVSPTKHIVPSGGFLYRIKRIDGASITNTDLSAVAIGQKVKIKSRRSYKQQFDQVVRLLES